MCGYVGYVSFSDRIDQKTKNKLEKSLNLLNHRGPDGGDTFLDHRTFLGHRRLSIIELTDAGKQPMFTEDKKVGIVYNGEIYNYRNLSKQISNLNSNSDTEVILKGYMLEGINFFKKLRGMYSFVIYDKEKNSLLMCRDPNGIKPLYYYHDKTQVVFSSEIKAMKSVIKSQLSINEDILKSYLSLGYCMEPFTIYNHLKALEPGECYTIDLNNNTFKKTKFFEYSFIEKRRDNYKYETKKYLNKAVKRNLVSDVPVSFALSGGIDSSLILAIANEKKMNSNAISVKFNESKYDESQIAKYYAESLNIKLDIIRIRNKSNIEELNKIFLHFDQPYADSSAIPFYFLSKAASRNTKVLIGGDGGDEIHNGYLSYRLLPYLWKYKNILSWFLQNLIKFEMLSPKLYRKINRLVHISSTNNFDQAVCNLQSWVPPTSLLNGESPFLFDPKIIYNTYEDYFSHIDNDSIYTDIIKNYFFKRMLSDYLRKTDMMSMLNSIEYRVPLLDEDLVQNSFSIPFNKKSTVFKNKKILRSIHKSYFKKKYSNQPKWGFSIPLDTWLSEDNFAYMHNYLIKKDGPVINYISKNYINALFDILKNNKGSSISREGVYQRILILYNLQNWYYNDYLNN